MIRKFQHYSVINHFLIYYSFAFLNFISFWFSSLDIGVAPVSDRHCQNGMFFVFNVIYYPFVNGRHICHWLELLKNADRQVQAFDFWDERDEIL